MKSFLSAVCLCLLLLILGLFILPPVSSQAENNLLANLIDLPAPPPPNPLVENNTRVRPENFYDKDKQPRDDAPIEDLIDYWKRQSDSYAELGYNIKPSDAAVQRILAEIENDPERVPDFINVLPENAEVASLVKRFYDQELSRETYGEEWTRQVKRWLTYHSNYFSEELLKDAREVKDENEYVTNQAELLALARVDWEKAEPILQRLLNDSSQPTSQTLARWAFYRHALDANDTSDIEKYRDELKKVVEDKNATPGMRDLAFDALVKETDWDRRDDWYLTLLEDETLFDLKVRGQSYTGLTTILLYSPPEKYLAKMIELVKSDKPAVRNAAVRNLITLLNSKNEEVVKALLPWLENPRWAKQVNNERMTLVNALASVKMPESVPGLISILNEKMRADLIIKPQPDSTETVTANTNQTEFYPYRYAAINALALQSDARAVPSLRALLLPNAPGQKVEDYERRMIVNALLQCRGFSIAEQVAGLEAAAYVTSSENIKNFSGAVLPTVASNRMVVRTVRKMETESEANVSTADFDEVPAAFANGIGNQAELNKFFSNRTPDDPNDTKVMLGTLLMETTEPEDELVAAVIARIEQLERKEPDLALALRKIVLKWNGGAVNSLLLRDLKKNKAELDAVVKLLSLRKDLREKHLNEIYDLRSGGGSVAVGIAACLLEENSEYDAILGGAENVESKIAMLGCARLIRARLPIQKVAENLQSQNKLLALAAERYLETEDSPEARQIVLSRHPNEAKILGARSFFYGGANSGSADSEYLRALFASVYESPASEPATFLDADFSEFESVDKKLQKEVRENQELLGIYSYEDNFIRIYRDKAVFSWEEDKARFRERVLTKDEFDEFKNYLAAQKVDDLAPFLDVCSEEDCASRELLMLGRNGGRRVFVSADKMPKFFVELDRQFGEMKKPPARLHYWLEKYVAGLEILLEDENLQARAVWKNGEDFRVLIANEARREQIDKELERQEKTARQSSEYDYEKSSPIEAERRRQREYEHFGWYRFSPQSKPPVNGVLQPPQFDYIPAQDNLTVHATDKQWKARTANFEIRANSEGLYKVTRGRLTKLREGYYDQPLVTPNGRWAIVTRYGDDAPKIVRINLLTGKEFEVAMEQQFPTYEAVAFVVASNKVLIFGGSYGGEEYEGEELIEDSESKEDPSSRPGNYFWLDPETGLKQPVKEEIRPLAQQTFRPLQQVAADKPDEFWSAIPDEKKRETQIGVYNARTHGFKLIMKIPNITFTSMNMWIDGGKVYFVYQGHLLALPLK